MKDLATSNGLSKNKLTTQLSCTLKDSRMVRCEAVISAIDVMGEEGLAIVLTPIIENKDDVVAEDVVTVVSQSEQRMNVIEQSLNSLLEIAKNDPSLLSGLVNLDPSVLQDKNSANDKAKVREQVVVVMRSALACWEHDLGKSKLQLAEESTIWPVYIDKSTPTTRTLDKYLHINSCPKNPRSQRVIDTAEFVLRKMKKETTPHRQKLEDELGAFRLSRSGIKK